MKQFLTIILVFGGALLFFHFKGKSGLEVGQEIRSWMGAKKKSPPGILFKELPQIRKLASATPWKKNGYVITPVAEYRLRCRVLQTWADLKSTEYQRHLGEFSRIEAALGWGPDSDQDLMDHITFYWRQDWYFWALDESFGDKYRTSEIQANLVYARILASPDVEEKWVHSISAGDLVEIEGRLVNVVSENGVWSVSSATDDDYSEDKAFRYIWVDSVKIL